MNARWILLSLGCLLACGAPQSQHASASPPPTASTGPTASTASAPPAPRQPPPAVAPPPVMHFPAIARSALPNGLELNVIEVHTLPVVNVHLVARAAGATADPARLPGLAAFAGDMLREGTHAHTSAQIAESIEFVGGTLSVTTDADATVIAVSVLADHAAAAMELLAEIVVDPIFPQVEIDKLRRREIDRLAQSEEDPSWLSRREFYRAIYGDHPYGQVDTTTDALAHFTRDEINAFHRARYVAGSMFVVAVGDVHAAEFVSLAQRTLGRIRRGTAPAIHFPPIVPRTGRQIVIVDRPDSAQTVIRIGNTALRRTSDDFVPLTVVNHVLGGEASSRLFMDLRERRSLTYGAYSRVTAKIDVGTFQATGSVRTEVTAQALDAFFEELDRITREAPAPDELGAAQTYLIDSFPISVETASDMAGLATELRLFGLADDYWDTYRDRISRVTPEAALHAAQQYIRPSQSVVVVVGSAATFETAARRLGPVRVVDASGRVVRESAASAAP